jgi:hypothetical protein
MGIEPSHITQVPWLSSSRYSVSSIPLRQNRAHQLPGHFRDDPRFIKVNLEHFIYASPG